MKARYAAVEDKDSPIYQQRIKESFADAARLAYVATTRAQHLCHFYLSPQSQKHPEHHAIYQMPGMPDDAAFQQLVNNSSGCIRYSPVPKSIFDRELSPWIPDDHHTPDTKSALITRATSSSNLTRHERTTSFTGITLNIPEMVHDIDSKTDEPETPIRQTQVDSEFWSQLQAGASLGLVFLETLEEIDFQNPQGLDQLVE